MTIVFVIVAADDLYLHLQRNMHWVYDPLLMHHSKILGLYYHILLIGNNSVSLL